MKSRLQQGASGAFGEPPRPFQGREMWPQPKRVMNLLILREAKRTRDLRREALQEEARSKGGSSGRLPKPTFLEAAQDVLGAVHRYAIALHVVTTVFQECLKDAKRRRALARRQKAMQKSAQGDTGANNKINEAILDSFFEILEALGPDRIDLAVALIQRAWARYQLKKVKPGTVQGRTGSLEPQDPVHSSQTQKSRKALAQQQRAERNAMSGRTTLSKQYRGSGFCQARAVTEEDAESSESSVSEQDSELSDILEETALELRVVNALEAKIYRLCLVIRQLKDRLGFEGFELPEAVDIVTTFFFSASQVLIRPQVVQPPVQPEMPKRQPALEALPMKESPVAVAASEERLPRARLEPSPHFSLLSPNFEESPSFTGAVSTRGTPSFRASPAPLRAATFGEFQTPQQRPRTFDLEVVLPGPTARRAYATSGARTFKQTPDLHQVPRNGMRPRPLKALRPVDGATRRPATVDGTRPMMQLMPTPPQVVTTPEMVQETDSEQGSDSGTNSPPEYSEDAEPISVESVDQTSEADQSFWLTQRRMWDLPGESQLLCTEDVEVGLKLEPVKEEGPVSAEYGNLPDWRDFLKFENSFSHSGYSKVMATSIEFSLDEPEPVSRLLYDQEVVAFGLGHELEPTIRLPEWLLGLSSESRAAKGFANLMARAVSGSGTTTMLEILSGVVLGLAEAQSMKVFLAAGSGEGGGKPTWDELLAGEKAAESYADALCWRRALLRVGTKVLARQREEVSLLATTWCPGTLRSDWEMKLEELDEAVGWAGSLLEKLEGRIADSPKLPDPLLAAGLPLQRWLLSTPKVAGRPCPVLLAPDVRELVRECEGRQKNRFAEKKVSSQDPPWTAPPKPPKPGSMLPFTEWQRIYGGSAVTTNYGRASRAPKTPKEKTRLQRLPLVCIV